MARNHWTLDILSRIPPSHWTARFDASITELIEAADASDDALLIRSGWTMAVLTFGDRDWASRLWDSWCRSLASKKPTGQRDSPWYLSLLDPMEPAEREQRVVDLLERPPAGGEISLRQILPRLPRPWSLALARTYLSSLRQRLAIVAESNALPGDWSDWRDTAAHAATALPDECLEEALQGWPAPESVEPRLRALHQAIVTLTEVVRLRKELKEQIADRPQ